MNKDLAGCVVVLMDGPLKDIPFKLDSSSDGTTVTKYYTTADEVFLKAFNDHFYQNQKVLLVECDKVCLACERKYAAQLPVDS